MKIYLIAGSAGSFDNEISWNVKACVVKEGAENVAARLNAAAASVLEVAYRIPLPALRGWSKPEDYTAYVEESKTYHEKIVGLLKDLPLPYPGFTDISGSITYSVEELELED